MEVTIRKNNLKNNNMIDFEGTLLSEGDDVIYATTYYGGRVLMKKTVILRFTPKKSKITKWTDCNVSKLI